MDAACIFCIELIKRNVDIEVIKEAIQNLYCNFSREEIDLIFKHVGFN